MSPGSVVDLVRASIRDSPQRTAVLSRQAKLSYAQLGGIAGNISSMLRAHGASRAKPVAVCAEPSAAGIAAIVGVVLAGFSYVPVCPSLPRARIAAMVDRAGAECAIICDEALPSLGALGVVELAVDAGMTEFRDGFDSGAETAGEPAPDLGDPVAVIFTSGSTGAPKGVLVPHQALANRVAWGQREYPLSPDDRILQHTRYIYDFSAWEIFASLGYGATLVTGPFRNYPDFGELADTVEEFQVTVAHFVPAVMSGFVNYAGSRLAGSLTLLFSGGQTLSQSLARQVTEVSSAVLFNQYGPTETCIDSTFHRYRRTGGEDALDVPIGRAISATRTYLLDDGLDPVGTAARGEIYIGGAGVAYGYVGQAALTAQRFLPDPWGEPGDRMYRTGDVAARSDDDGLMFIGRIDRQVNIRGVRVELAEVESVIAACPGVSGAIATMTEDGSNLVAVAERTPGTAVGGDEVRNFVREQLPAAFVPDRIFVQDLLPRLPSGKTDRAATEQLAVSLSRVQESGRPPQDDPAGGLLQAVLDVWLRFFDVPHIPADADFFEFGGHSLLAVEVVSAVNDELDATIELADFFELPTPSNMVALLERRR